MDTTARAGTWLTHPADLVGALPYLLGFHPRDSLVVVTLRSGSPPRVGLVLRADLPPPGEEDRLAEHLCAPLRASGAGVVMIVAVGGRDSLPAAVAVLRRALGAVGVVVVRALWAESTARGARWSDLDEPDLSGLLPDPTCSDLAAATTVAGLVTFDTREDLAALVAPDPDDVLTRRAVLLDAAVSDDLGDADPASQVELVRAAVDAAAAGRLPTGDAEIVRLAVALSEPVVRDSCLGWCRGETADAAERLWQALTRMIPPPEVAEPAALAAMSAYLRGDGALAGIALDRAEQAWPGHNLSTLLCYVISNAVPPARLDQFVRDAAADAALMLAEAS